MNDRGFHKRLLQELPRWQEAGWVSVEGGQAILADFAARQARPIWATMLALIGALLLGMGVITWFAAHWNEMGKLLKVVLIISALLGSHIAHGWCLSRAAMPRLAQGMALLSVLFFGAAIMLIGQIYHIDAHFPDGVALWAAGGLLTAWLLVSQPALVAAIALAGLWTWQEQFTYRAANWPLLGFLVLSVIPLLRYDWRYAARGWGLLCMLWLLGWHAQPWLGDGSAWDSQAHIRLFALQLLGIAGCWALAQASSLPLARAIRTDFLLVALLGAFAFTFPKFALVPAKTLGASSLSMFGALALVALIVLYAAGIVRLVRNSTLNVERVWLGIVLAIAFAALLVFECIVPRSTGWPALVWNVLFLGVLYWIGDLGVRHGDRRMVNHAFLGFSLWVLARYFDTFWTLLDRSLFFMAGGVLLLAGGGWLERRRRGLVNVLNNAADKGPI